jgi:hypothetical protein
MKYLHCQLRVADFEKWKSVLDADASAQQAAGLRLLHLWRSIDSPGLAFFVMEVQDVDQARTTYLTPIFYAWAKKGVHQYEWHFTEEVALPVV